MTGLRVPGACGDGLPPGPWVTAPARQGRVSAHGGSGSSVAASPGSASPAGLSRRPPYAGARARPHRLPGTCRAPLRRAAASTAAPARAHRPRPPPPAPRVPREAVRGTGDAASRAEGAAWGQRAPRARPAPEPRGACARRGRGARACVCVGAGRAAAARQVVFFSEGGPGGGPEDGNCREGALAPGPSLTSSTFFHSLRRPQASPSRYRS